MIEDTQPYPSETSSRRHLTVKYCQGLGLDLGSGGDPVVPSAIQVELLRPYTPDLGNKQFPIQLRGDAANLYWFRNSVLDYVYSSHLLEDFEDWMPLLREWTRVLKIGGYLVIMIPDKVEWRKAVKNGQPPNLSHKHEGYPGELTLCMKQIGNFDILEDRITDKYNILFVAKKNYPHVKLN